MHWKVLLVYGFVFQIIISPKGKGQRAKGKGQSWADDRRLRRRQQRGSTDRGRLIPPGTGDFRGNGISTALAL